MRVALRRLFRLANPPVRPMSPAARPRGCEPPLQDHDAAHLAHRHRQLCCCAAASARSPIYLANAADRADHRGGPAQQRRHPRGAVDRRAARARAVQHPAAIKIVDGGPPDAATAIENGQADLAVVRRDSGMPKNGQAVAILRKNVVVFIVPSAAEPPPSRVKGKAARQGQADRKDREDRADASASASAWSAARRATSSCSR